MKIERLRRTNSKHVKLQLIKTKTYYQKENFQNIKIEDIESRLKKAMNIIYKYHSNNKKIWFVGMPLETSVKLNALLKNTKHVLIPGSNWTNGILTNALKSRTITNKKSYNSKMSEFLTDTKQKSDLIVVLDKTENINAIEEGYQNRVPIIAFSIKLNLVDQKPSFKVPGNFSFTKKKIRDNIFYSLLSATIKKAQLTKITNLTQKNINKQAFTHKKNTSKPLNRKHGRYNKKK